MRSWSISLFRVRGIELAVHATFFLLIGYVVWQGWHVAGGSHWQNIVASLMQVLAAFTCVVLHELGHAFTAQSLGIVVPRILLLPIGGMAELESIPREPRKEILIAIAGPAVNLALILFLLCFSPLPSKQALMSGHLTFLQYVMVVNITMFCLNLLPVFPMDGGRVLRAALATKLNYLRATLCAATLGEALALVLGFYAVRDYHQWPLAILFGFIFVIGEIEYRAVKSDELARQRDAEDDVKAHSSPTGAR